MDREMEFAQAIKDGALDLICPEMELLVCPGYEDVAMKGTGVIRSDSLGRLYFRLVAPFKGPPHNVLQPAKLPGELYSPSDHVMLRAVDEEGVEWRSNWMVVDLRFSVPLGNWRVRENLSTLMYSDERRPRDGSAVRILIPNFLAAPFDGVTRRTTTVGGKEVEWSSSFDFHAHKIGETEVVFRRGEGHWLSVFAGSTSTLMPTWPGLMCQALGFALAQTVRPALIAREFQNRADLTLLSGPFWRSTSTMPPPVQPNDPARTQEFWRLVELFFTHTEAADSEQLLEELEGIRRGAQGSFQTACLTLGVGIESIANLVLKDQPPKGVGKKVVQGLLEHLDAWPGDSALKNRVKGLLGRLAEHTASDRMYAWAKRTGSPPDLLENWKKLRHPRAHGKAVDHQQSGYDVYYSSIELLYRIVASAIGYSGPIVQSSQRGWPGPQTTEQKATEDELGKTD